MSSLADGGVGTSVVDAGTVLERGTVVLTCQPAPQPDTA